ncbi:uncharacterized protein LOC118202203 isoform X2 [Stegodyphus dumicola]|uniref:uncharacterized protein LOC118202203 isoform X2 n=1 Tax=Stegodyphus dumicola TaxID=202533 RepID=UPI0015ADFE46|nr:uncharacterized protein LOC118202203 isoform X2 [Stegodyphus dumicola]
MDIFDCNSSISESNADLSSVLISAADMRTGMLDDTLCDDEALSEKDITSDLASLDNLEILHTCSDNDFSSTNVMDCLSNINHSPETFDIPSIDNDDSVLPLYGPYAEFESPSFETHVIDLHAVPGVCGLRNLGNTCFMNAGLQCLLNNKIFKNFFCEQELESFVKGTLSYKFADIMKKVWSGSYSMLNLSEFKECFGALHLQFQNFRQHDCQEFLALLLDTMHEELNSASKSKDKVNNTHIVRKSCENSLSSSSSKPLQFEGEYEKKMEVCDAKETSEKNVELNSTSAFESGQEFHTDIAKNSILMNGSSGPNNIKQMKNVSSSVKKKNLELDTAIYERNTEKMADLLINNKKLEEILNKNELDVPQDMHEQNYSNHKIKTEAKNNIQHVSEKLEKNILANKFNSSRKIPSIEDFVKDTKTLNTNVLVSDETNNLFKFDSEKFPKHDFNRLQETVDNLGQIVDLGGKQGGVKRVKITNIMHEKHKILENNSEHSSCSALHKRLKIENMDTNLDSPVTEPEDAIDMEQIPGDECSDNSSQSSELYALNSECRVLLFAEEIRRAYNHWEQYKSQNQSVIIDTFHGQFRSSVVCSQCSHVSITYEPFMYLPVFLPHALERQIVITFIQNNGMPPVCYLVNVNKFDRVHKIREALQRLLDATAEEIILAEVFENHISRILDENQSISRVNDSSRSVYAFEVGKICEQNSDNTKNSNAIPLDCTEDKKNFTNTSSFFGNGVQKQTSEVELLQNCDLLKCSSPLLDKQKEDNLCLVTDLMQNNPACKYDAAKVNLAGEFLPVSGPVQWHSCAICLEELPDYSLSLHPSCECILCSNCIEVSCKHYGGATFICPVCSSSVSPTDDFVPLTRIGDYKFKISTIAIPIVMRHDVFQEDILKEKNLIGHPGLLKLPSSLPASKLYEHVDKAIPFLSTYSLLLVDGQGKNCSRCFYNEHCSGCEIARVGEIRLHPGDSIAVRYVDLPPEVLASASFVAEHKSMQQARHKAELDIYDCLEYFSERESLDEDSPWFCPVCRRNQQATKSLSVWKFPEVLIICLKRC